MFRPIASQGLVKGKGNHEVTLQENYSDAIAEHCASDLGIPYGGYQYFLRLIFDCYGRRHSWLIHGWHGSGTAQSEGARVMRLMRLVNEIQADIYLMGHLHGYASYETARLSLDDKGLIHNHPLIAVMTSSWLLSYKQDSETYGEIKGYKPSVIGPLS